MYHNPVGLGAEIPAKWELADVVTYSSDVVPKPNDAPVVELGLEYDPEPARVKWAGIPLWLIGVGVAAYALSRL